MMYTALPLEQFLDTLDMSFIHVVECKVQSGNQGPYVWSTNPFPLLTSVK